MHQVLTLSMLLHRSQAQEYHQQAHMLFKAMKVYELAASDSYRNNKRSDGNSHRDKADSLRSKANNLKALASQLSYRANNQHTNTWTIDLHGMRLDAAMAEVTKQLNWIKMNDSPGGAALKIITGVGHHSKDNKPVIKLNVIRYLEDTGADFHVNPENPGEVIVQFAPP